MNVYGLMAIQKWVAKKVGLRPGAITVVSHSMGLDPKELDRAMLIIGKRPFKVQSRPHGLLPDHPGRQGNPGGAPLRGRHPEGVPGQDRRISCSTRSPGTWPSRISTTPSTWGASWPRPRWPSRTAGSSCRISCQQQLSAFSSSQGLGEGKMSGGHCPPFPLSGGTGFQPVALTGGTPVPPLPIYRAVLRLSTGLHGANPAAHLPRVTTNFAD